MNLWPPSLKFSCIILSQLWLEWAWSSRTNPCHEARIRGEVQVSEGECRLGKQYKISQLFKTNAYPLSREQLSLNNPFFLLHLFILLFSIVNKNTISMVSKARNSWPLLLIYLYHFHVQPVSAFVDVISFYHLLIHPLHVYNCCLHLGSPHYLPSLV